MTTTDGSPSRAPDDKGPVEVSDPELIVSRSAIEATHNSPLTDCPSATSLDSSISSDGEMSNRRGGSCMSLGSPVGSVKRVSFSPSPPQVREYERYDMGRKQPSSPHKGEPVQFNNLNKKRRMLKKKLDKLNGDGEKSAAPVQKTQTVTRIAKKLGQAFLMVSTSALTSPGARTTKIKHWLSASPVAKLPVSDTSWSANFRRNYRRRRQTSKKLDTKSDSKQ
jgi:hypothetical protein